MANGMIAGIGYPWVAYRDLNGYPVGQNKTPNTKVNGTLYTPYITKYPVTFTPATPTRQQAVRRGQQGIRGKRDMGISDLGNAQLVLDAYNEELHAIVSGTNIDTTTMSGWSATSQNVGQDELPQLIFGISIGFTNSNGLKEWMTCVYHNCQIAPVMPQSSQEGGVNPNPLTYEIIPDMSSRQGFGRLFSASNLDVVDDNDMFTVFRYRDPIFVETFVKDGTENEVQLTYLPTTSDATGAATNSLTNNGATQAVTSISTSTGLMTLASATTAADIFVAAYPTRHRLAA